MNQKSTFLSEETVFQILRSRRKFVDAVVITGGEPTMHQDLPLFIDRLRKDGFSIKLDTNGFFPEILEKCLPSLDYVALDVKTSLKKYFLLGAKEVKNLLKTIDIIKSGNVNYEFRTTLVPGIVEEDDLSDLGELVKGTQRFYLQQFISKDTLDKSYRKIEKYSDEEISRFFHILKEHVKNVSLRI
jgi:pyruvate formate lyase activating enzyme